MCFHHHRRIMCLWGFWEAEAWRWKLTQLQFEYRLRNIDNLWLILGCWGALVLHGGCTPARPRRLPHWLPRPPPAISSRRPPPWIGVSHRRLGLTMPPPKVIPVPGAGRPRQAWPKVCRVIPYAQTHGRCRLPYAVATRGTHPFHAERHVHPCCEKGRTSTMSSMEGCSSRSMGHLQLFHRCSIRCSMDMPSRPLYMSCTQLHMDVWHVLVQWNGQLLEEATWESSDLSNSSIIPAWGQAVCRGTRDVMVGQVYQRKSHG